MNTRRKPIITINQIAST